MCHVHLEQHYYVCELFLEGQLCHLLPLYLASLFSCSVGSGLITQANSLRSEMVTWAAHINCRGGSRLSLCI